MVKRAPVRFDPARLAGKAETLSVALPLGQFKRLRDNLYPPPDPAPSPEGAGNTAMGLADTDARYRLDGQFRAFFMDDRLWLEGAFTACVPLQCQRCMGLCEHSVEHQFKLVVVENESQAEALEQELEPIILDENGCLHLVDLFEDELLLQLPLIPRHAEFTDCQFDDAIAALLEPVTIGPTNGQLTGEQKAHHAITDSDSAVRGSESSARQANPFDVLKQLKFDD